MKTRYKIIIGIFVACLAVAAGIWMEVRTGRQMRAAVEQALEQNRNYVPFTSDTIYLGVDSSDAVTLRDAVAYYRHPLHHLWTSPNDLLRAGYALGCVYRDLHEAPIAIITWEEAVAAADTTADDCDYATLYRVYGQMASLYMWQHLPERQLSCEKCYSKYALLAGDTLISLHGKLLCNSAYYTLGDTAAIFANSEAVRQQYLKLGLTKEAAKVYPTPIHVAVEQGQYERARRMMDEYERNSGLFDYQGYIIDPSRLQYHYYKGLYYLGIHQNDSAELQFRILLSDSIHLVDAYRGLFMLYQNKLVPDSALLHGRLYEKALRIFLDHQNSDAIIQAQALYDYQRQEKIARKENKKNKTITSLLLLFSLSVALGILYTLKKRRAKIQAMKNLEQEFSQNEKDLEKARAQLRYMQNQIQDLEDDSRHIAADLEERIHRLEEQQRHDASILGKLDIIEREERLMADETVLLFQRICHQYNEERNDSIIKKPARKALKKEWVALRETIKREHLSFFLGIESNNSLTPQEKEVAYLSRIGLQTKEMATIIGCSSQSVSNARAGISLKLFNSDETLKVGKKLKDL